MIGVMVPIRLLRASSIKHHCGHFSKKLLINLFWKKCQRFLRSHICILTISNIKPRVFIEILFKQVITKKNHFLNFWIKSFDWKNKKKTMAVIILDLLEKDSFWHFIYCYLLGKYSLHIQLVRILENFRVIVESASRFILSQHYLKSLHVLVHSSFHQFLCFFLVTLKHLKLLYSIHFKFFPTTRRFECGACSSYSSAPKEQKISVWILKFLHKL